jgi:voltage-gated potassium channel
VNRRAVRINRLRDQQLTRRRAVWAISAVTVAVTVLSGVAMWLVDRDDFPNVWLGFWWAIQTVTTVGYGDVTPTHPAGRVIAGLVMVTGIGFLTVVTASVTALFIESVRHRSQREARDSVDASLEDIAERLDRIEAALSDRG